MECTASEAEILARQVARLTLENDELKKRVGDAENRHDALREEFDLFRVTMLEQLGIRSLKVLRRGAMTVIS